MKNLNYVGSLVQMDLQDYTTHSLTRIMQYAIDCYKSVLRYKTNQAVKVAYLQANDVLNASFPKDYEYYTKVAINVGGQLVTLSINNDIPFVRKADCGVPIIDPATVTFNTPDTWQYTYGFLYAPHYRNGMYVGEMYSYGGGFNDMGYFRLDFENRQFQFYNIPKSEIVLEYVADTHTTGETLIPYMDVPVIRAFIHWQLAENDRKITLAEKDRKHGLFNYQLQERIATEFIPTMSDYLDSTYRAYNSSVKR